MMSMRLGFFIFCSFVFQVGLAQTDLKVVEQEIVQLMDNNKNAQNDTEKETINQQILSLLKATYNNKEAFNYPFSAIKNIGFISSPDNQLKIINWNLEKEDNTQKYYGLIVHFDPIKKVYNQYELIHTRSPFEPFPPTKTVSNTDWYGALYYKIIPNGKGNKITYTLLGYDANNNSSHIKFIDVLSFVGKKARFGAPIFKDGKKTHRRVLFEHSKKSFMSLKYDESRGRIVFDHLSPENPIMKDFREFYVPDMSYDAYEYENGKWNLIEDIIATNEESKNKKNKTTITVYDMNKEGEFVSTEKESKWIDPTDKNAPAGSNIHTPALPDPVKKKGNKRTAKSQNIDSKTLKSKKKSDASSYYQNILKSNSKKKTKQNKKAKIRKK